MSLNSFNSFDEVVSAYNRTKPMVSNNHTVEDDVRPIGRRNRKWERIKKHDDNTYLLTCFYPFNDAMKNPLEHERDRLCSPIVWSRENGQEYITVRNCHENHILVSSVSSFITKYLPRAIRFCKRGSTYSLAVVTGCNADGFRSVTEFLLPKHRIEIALDRAPNGRMEVVAVEDVDELYLKFRRNPDGTFTRVSKPMAVQLNHVDKDLKKEWKAHIETFYKFCCVYKDILLNAARPRQLQFEYGTKLQDWMDEKLGISTPRSASWPPQPELPPDLAREIVADEQHEMRAPFAVLLMLDIGMRDPIESEKDVTTIRARFNRHMNNKLNLIKTEEV